MHAITFGMLAVGMAVFGAAHGGAAMLLFWPALSFALVAGAYAGLGPRVFGKDTCGRMALPGVLLLLPFLALLRFVWHAARLLGREPASHEVSPGLWVGRRPLAGEVPPGVATVVDLTCEFSAQPAAVAGRRYLCLPTLDACAPTHQGLRELLRQLRDESGGILIHCASGHGRSPLAAAGLLLARGRAATAAEALAIVRKGRPGVRLHPCQYRLLESLQDVGRSRSNHE